MLRKLPKSIFLLGMILVSQLISAQTELKADGGTFEEIAPWGDGYLGVVKTQAVAVVPKFRLFQYFDKNGVLKWNKKITPFNFFNTTVCHPESEHAYFVNMPFAKTAATEKTSKTEFLTIHQIDRSGNVIEKSLTYTDELKPLADNLKDLNRSYIGAVKDGFVIVVSAVPTSYFVVRVDSKLNVTTQTIDVEWDESKFIDRKLSLPKFAINDNYFTIIQLKLVDDKIQATLNTMSLSDITNVKTTLNQIAFNDYAFHYNVGTDVNYSISEKQFVEHMREDWKGNTIYNYTTLGSYLDFNYVGDQLKCYGYYKNVNSSTEKVEKEGVLVYALNPNEEIAVGPNPLTINGDENGTLHLGVYWGKENEFVAVSLQRNYNFVLVSSLEEEKKIKGNVSAPQVFASFITGKEVKETEEINAVAKIGNRYVGLKFQGIDDYFVKNGLGTSVRKVTIYEY